MYVGTERRIKTCLTKFLLNVCQVFCFPDTLGRQSYKLTACFNYSNALADTCGSVKSVCIGHALNTHRKIASHAQTANIDYL